MSSKIALVTGAGSGIGRAVSIALSSAGFAVVLAGRRREELERTATLAPGETRVAPVDITNPESVKALFSELDRLDLLFNSAGMGAPAVPMDELTFEQWAAVVNVNLTGSFLCAQRANRTIKNHKP